MTAPRSIRLQLGSTTTATGCGDCPAIGPLALGGRVSCVPFCARFDAQISDDESRLPRLKKCLKAEAAQAQMERDASAWRRMKSEIAYGMGVARSFRGANATWESELRREGGES